MSMLPWFDHRVRLMGNSFAKEKGGGRHATPGVDRSTVNLNAIKTIYQINTSWPFCSSNNVYSQQHLSLSS